MIAAFLTVARLSDYVGRKPMIVLALGLNAVALLLFFVAGSAGTLILARAVQGVATGIALATLGALLADTAPQWAATLNSVTAFMGLALGALISGIFVTFAPWPTHLVYALLLGVTLAEMVIIAWIAETTSRKAGAWSGMKPRLTVPKAAAAPMARLFPLTLSAWALGGFYLSLMPSLVIEATGIRSPLVGAAVVSALMVSGGLSSLATRALDAGKMVRGSAALLAAGIVLTLFAIAAGSPIGMFFGTIVAGAGFGASYGASLRVLLPLASAHERAGLLSAYFVEILSRLCARGPRSRPRRASVRAGYDGAVLRLRARAERPCDARGRNGCRASMNAPSRQSASRGDVCPHLQKAKG